MIIPSIDLVRGRAVQLVGGEAQRMKVCSARLIQRDAIVDADFAAAEALL